MLRKALNKQGQKKKIHTTKERDREEKEKISNFLEREREEREREGYTLKVLFTLNRNKLNNNISKVSLWYFFHMVTKKTLHTCEGEKKEFWFCPRRERKANNNEIINNFH